MYSSDIPSRAELPSTAQLIKSTIIAFITAIIILITIVLPAEYAIDPTGVGRMLKLTEMGEIKKQLAEEAERDRQLHGTPPATPRSNLMDRVLAELVIGKAQAQERMQLAQAPTRTDETVITLRPTEGVEWKMTMIQGAQVRYAWTVQGGIVNYDMHGTPLGGGKETSYETARGIGADEGLMTAGFDGAHGWFFRNRGAQPVTITLRTMGAYTELKRVQWPDKRAIRPSRGGSQLNAAQPHRMRERMREVTISVRTTTAKIVARTSPA